jgi:outer membrane protein assembly factor BamB
MLNNIHIIEKIWGGFQLSENQITYCSTLGGVHSFKISNFEQVWSTIKEEKCSFLIQTKNFIFSNNVSSKYCTWQLDIKSGEIIRVFNNYALNNYIEVLDAVLIENENSCLSYSPTQLSTLWTIPNKPFRVRTVFNKQILISLKKLTEGHLSAIDLKDGHTIWRKDLFDIIPSNGRLEKKYGIFNNVCYLLAIIDDGFYREHRELFALNASSGEIIWHQNTDSPVNSVVVFNENKYSLFSAYFTASEEEGVIVEFNEVGIPISEVMPKTFYYNEILEVDLSDGQVIRKEKLNFLYDELKLRLIFYIYDNNRIYFVAERGNDENDYEQFLGILDYNTLQLIDYQLVEFKEGGSLMELQVQENKIFARDSEGYLYIYEQDFSHGHLAGEKSDSH